MKRTIAVLSMLFLLGPIICRAHDDNLVRNGDFDRDISAWSFWFAPGQSEGGAKWVARDGGGALQADVSRRDRSSSIQIYYGPFPVRKDQRYVISFQAKAEERWILRVGLMRHQSPYGNLGLSAEAPLTNEWRTYSLIATATQDSDVARIDFFPEKSFTLDAVGVRPVEAVPPGEIAALKPAAIRLGRDWRDDPKALLDGNAKTSVRSRYCPVEPLFVVADLGAPKTVRQVVVNGFDAGRHHYTSRIDVEASNDGKRWFQWAKCTKDGDGEGPHPTTFQASSLAVHARCLRLRVSHIRGGAILTGLSILGGESGGIDPSLLPEIHPAQDLAFLGWDYDQLGYAITPGERVALSWADQGETDVSVPVAWRLTTYDGRELARGEGNLNVKANATGDVPMALPHNLDDGPKVIHCEFPKEAGVPEQLFYFDYRDGKTGDNLLDLRIVALHDSQDPEGWARMMAGPLGRHMIASRDWPEGQRIDATVVMAENWKADDPRVVKLKSYVRDGGKALVYGKPPAALGDLVPVTVDADRPWIEKPMRLQALDGGPWVDFDPKAGPRHYGVNAAAKDGAKVLATWDDGAPAVVEAAFGKGTVVYVGAGSGQVWQERPEMAGVDELGLRLLYRLAGREHAIARMLDRAKEISAKAEAERRAVADRVFERLSVPRPERYVVPSLTNVGRFGWQVQEGGLVDNLGRDARLLCPAEPDRPVSILVDGVEKLTGRSLEQNWLAKTIAWSDGRRDVLRSTVSMASPAILWEGDARQLRISTPGVTHMAYPSTSGVRIVANGGEAPAPRDVTGNWIVLFTADEKHRDVPKLVVLTRRPTAMTFDGQLTLSFSEGGFGALFTSRLWGLRRLAPGETRAWVKGLPKEAAASAQRWGRAFLSFPTACDEVAWVEGETIVVADRLRFRAFTDEWNTPPLSLAVLPPVASLARSNGAPIDVPKNLIDCKLATKYGPIEAVEGDSILYRIALPSHDHYGVIPVEGQMDLQGSIDGYGVQGIETVKRASGGLTGDSNFLEDLRAYMSSGEFPPFEAPCIDLYKWWYCFPTVLGRPAFTTDARAKVDAHYRRQYWETLNFYPHKSFIRYRREPWTNMDYTISFIWPVAFQDGVRYFVDQNESSAVIAYCAWAYAQYYGDWTTLRANWNLLYRLYEYLPKFHDWAWMASSNQEFFSTAGIDMLNSEYPGNLAFARAARQVGNREGETVGLVLAAKALVPTVARFAMPDYVRSITADGDPWREDRYYYGFNEDGLRGAKNIEMRGGPESILHLAIGMLDTSKGTSPEIVLAYKSWIPKRIDAYERDLKAAEGRYDVPAGWMHLMQRALLRWPRAELIATAKKFHAAMPNWGWQSTKGPHNMALICTTDTPVFLADWSPAEYLSGRYDPEKREVALRFQAHEDAPYAVRLYTQRRPEKVLVHDRQADKAQYDDKSGWLVVNLSGVQEQRIVIRLGDPVAPQHPYFTPLR